MSGSSRCLLGAFSASQENSKKYIDGLLVYSVDENRMDHDMRNNISQQRTYSSSLLARRSVLQWRVLKLLSLIFVIFPFQSSAFGQVSDTATIAYVQQLSTSDIDSTMSGGALGDWVQALVGRSVKVEWELNDCGEQTGVPMIDAERDIPMCVGAYAALPGDVRLGITIIIGTNERGPIDSPAIYDIYVQSGKNVRTFRHLNDLAKALNHPSPKH